MISKKALLAFTMFFITIYCFAGRISYSYYSNPDLAKAGKEKLRSCSYYFYDISSLHKLEDLYDTDIENLKRKIKNINYQLPEKLLKKFSVKELVMFSIDSPYNLFTVFGRWKGAEKIKEFNGFNEIFKRKNFFEQIFRYS